MLEQSSSASAELRHASGETLAIPLRFRFNPRDACEGRTHGGQLRGSDAGRPCSRRRSSASYPPMLLHRVPRPQPAAQGVQRRTGTGTAAPATIAARGKQDLPSIEMPGYSLGSYLHCCAM
uniref:Uncharacterized protein n=1 Tax=Setaria italica TaxID=4555 RepID=K3ZAU3_SETIT